MKLAHEYARALLGVLTKEKIDSGDEGEIFNAFVHLLKQKGHYK